MMSHIMERYFTNTADTGFIDGQAEAAMRSIMHFGRVIRREPKNYSAWSQIGLAGTFAHNGFYGLGQEERLGLPRDGTRSFRLEAIHYSR